MNSDFCWSKYLAQQFLVPIFAMLPMTILGGMFQRPLAVIGLASPILVGYLPGQYSQRYSLAFQRSGSIIWLPPLLLFFVLLVGSVLPNTASGRLEWVFGLLLLLPIAACGAYAVGFALSME